MIFGERLARDRDHEHSVLIRRVADLLRRVEALEESTIQREGNLRKRLRILENEVECLMAKEEIDS